MGLRKRPYTEDKKSGKGGDSKKSFRTPRPGGEGKEGSGAPAKRSYKRADSSAKSEGRFGKERGERPTPAKRAGGFKRNDGDDRRPGRFSEGKAPAKRSGGYKRTEGEDTRKHGRFSSEGKAPSRRPGGFKREEGDDTRKPGRFSSDDRAPARRTGGFKREEGGRFSSEGRTPAKRTGGFKRDDNNDTRRPGRLDHEGDKPVRRAGYSRGGSSDDRGARRPAPGRTGFGSRDDRQDSRGRFGRDEHEERPRTSKSGKPYMVRGAKARDIKAKSDEKLDLLSPEEVRLNRYISNSGICSRREADDLIAAGLVAVNGKIVTEMGFKVQPGDEVRYNNERLSWEKKVYLLMNKPKDFITTSDDPDGRKIIMDLIKDPRLPRVYPVGRLDRNTTGVILLTNDGELAQRLTHPKYNITKVYKATLNKSFAAKDMQELANNGVELEDGPIKPDVVGIPSASEKEVVMVQIHSGRNHIIHRMFEAMGYLVDKLDRIDFAGLERKGLDRSEWRHLDDKEIKKLKKLVQLK